MKKQNKRIAMAVFIAISFGMIAYHAAKANVEHHSHFPMISRSIDSTPVPVVMPTPDLTPHGREIIVKVSHYNPALGGVNCARWEDDECKSKMSNGERWQDYMGNMDTIACPAELPFGTVINFGGDAFTCRDRGGAIVITKEGYYWIDILAESVPYKFGELQTAWITRMP